MEEECSGRGAPLARTSAARLLQGLILFRDAPPAVSAGLATASAWWTSFAAHSGSELPSPGSQPGSDTAKRLSRPDADAALLRVAHSALLHTGCAADGALPVRCDAQTSPCRAVDSRPLRPKPALTTRRHAFAGHCTAVALRSVTAASADMASGFAAPTVLALRSAVCLDATLSMAAHVNDTAVQASGCAALASLLSETAVDPKNYFPGELEAVTSAAHAAADALRPRLGPSEPDGGSVAFSTLARAAFGLLSWAARRVPSHSGPLIPALSSAPRGWAPPLVAAFSDVLDRTASCARDLESPVLADAASAAADFLALPASILPKGSARDRIAFSRDACFGRAAAKVASAEEDTLKKALKESAEEAEVRSAVAEVDAAEAAAHGGDIPDNPWRDVGDISQLRIAPPPMLTATSPRSERLNAAAVVGPDSKTSPRAAQLNLL